MALPRRLSRLCASLSFALLLAPLPAVASDFSSTPPPTDPDAAFARAAKLMAIAEYAEAAARYEDAARRFPAAPAAPNAWNDAILIRLALGDIDRATQDADDFQRLYGAKRGADAVKLKLGVISVLIDRGDLAGAGKRLERLLPQVDRFGRYGDRIDAHTLLGRALHARGDARGAAREYALVLGMVKEPEVLMERLTVEGDDEPARLRRLGRALTAIGEAAFFMAEQHRAAVDAIRFPEYRGPATRERLIMHVGTPVAEWLRNKRVAIESAERAYLLVLQIAPAPPPRWVIASGARVGQMWSRFVDELRAAPLPRAWKDSDRVPGHPDMTYGELRRYYQERISTLSEPLMQRAKAAYRTCLAYSVKYQYIDEHARSCAEWLTANYRREFPPLDELLPPLAVPALSLLPAPLPDPRP